MKPRLFRATAAAVLLTLAVLAFLLPPPAAAPVRADGPAKGNVFHLEKVEVHRSYSFINPDKADKKLFKEGEEDIRGNPGKVEIEVSRITYTHKAPMTVDAPSEVQDGQTVTLKATTQADWGFPNVKLLDPGNFGIYLSVKFIYRNDATDKLESPGFGKSITIPPSHTLKAETSYTATPPKDGTFGGGVNDDTRSFFVSMGSSFFGGDKATIEETWIYRRGPATSAPSGPAPTSYPPTFAGEWGDWGPKVGAHRGTPPPGTEGTWGTWTFQQNGDRVTETIPNMGGKYGPATITGTVSGKTLTGTWKSPTAGGTIALTRSGDDSSFAGVYTVDARPGESPGRIGPPVGPGTQGPQPPLPEGMILQAPDLIVAKGSRVLVPVQLLNAKDVLGMDFELAYLPDIAAAQAEAEKGSVVTDIWQYKLNQPGLFKFNFAQLAPFAGQGTVGGFRFDAIGPGRGKTPLTLSVHRVDGPDGAKLPITVINGSITIYDPIDLTDPNNPKNPNRPGGTETPPPQPTCSGTGRQTVNDAQCCLKMWVGLIPKSLVMDLNSDNEVDSADALIVLQNVAKDLAR